MNPAEFKSLAVKKGYDRENKKGRAKIYSLYNELKKHNKLDVYDSEIGAASARDISSYDPEICAASARDISSYDPEICAASARDISSYDPEICAASARDISSYDPEIEEYLITGFLFQKTDEGNSEKEFSAEKLHPELSKESWMGGITKENLKNYLGVILPGWKQQKEIRDTRKSMQESIADQTAKQTAVRCAFSITQGLGGEITPPVVLDVYKQIKKQFPVITLEEVKRISMDYL